MITRSAVGLVLVLLPATAAAQTARAGLPFVTIDGLVGSSSNPQRTGATFYESGGVPAARVAVAVRIGSKAGVRPVAVLDYSGVPGRGDDILGCLIAPNGSCKQRFPSISGVAVGLGARGMLGNWITLGVTGGVGRYRFGYTSNGFSFKERPTGFHVGVDISARFMKHAGLVVNVRHVEVEKFEGARMWYRPITFGLRFNP